MSTINQPLTPGPGGRSPEDLDGLVRAFFRAELPEPWPTLKPPAEPSAVPVRDASRRWSRNSSRWALAASVALLLIGQLFLSKQFGDPSTAKSDETLRAPVADRHSIKIRSYKVEVEEAVGPDGRVVPKVKSLTIRAESEKGR